MSSDDDAGSGDEIEQNMLPETDHIARRRKKVLPSNRKANRDKRRKAVASAKPRAMFVPAPDTQVSQYDRWLAAIFDLYADYPEVVNPVLNPDGTPAADPFGRPKHTDAHREDGIQPGAVWFTRETLRKAWFEVFGTVAYREMRKNQLIYKEVEVKSAAHPMDSAVADMTKDGRLIRKRKNALMISKEECERLGRPDIWKLHLDRGRRWEGLAYSEKRRLTSELHIRKRAIYDKKAVVTRTPTSVMDGMHSPAYLEWEYLRTTYLSRFLVFDRNTLARLAIEHGAVIAVTDMEDARIDNHVSRWLKVGKIVKVLPRLYQAKEFLTWNEGRDRYARPFLPETKEWITEWIFHAAETQVNDPTSQFTTRDIIDHFEELADKDDPWARQHLPLQFGLNTVSSRLREYIKAGYIENVGSREKRITDTLLEFFKPLSLKGNTSGN